MAARAQVDRPLAVVDAVNTASPVTWWVHVDHLNRPVLMTDAAKAQVWQAVWKPFGEAQSITGPAALDTRFPGQWFQIESGLHYNWHRHYDPTTGRYTQPDPLGFVDGPGVYGYARSKPIHLEDSTGLKTCVFISSGTGSSSSAFGHAAVLVIPDDGGEPFFFDPGGSFGDPETGSCRCGPTNYNDFSNYMAEGGGGMKTYCFNTTPAEEDEIQRRVLAGDIYPPGYCARDVGDVLDGIGPFNGVSGFTFPSSLGNQLSKIPPNMSPIPR